jgi:predicted enzyme related to lactoylglutathione lyase
MQLRGAMIFVKDLNRMVDFYANTIGFKAVDQTRMETWVEFESGAARFSLHAIPSEIAEGIVIASPPKPRETGAVKLSLAVDDVDSEVRRLRALGVQIIERPWGSYDVVDPEGNVVGLTA